VLYQAELCPDTCILAEIGPFLFCFGGGVNPWQIGGSAAGASQLRATKEGCRMGPVVHFEIHAEDPERAAKFYSSLFGWEVKHLPEMQYWLVTAHKDGESGINGGILRRRGPRPLENAPVNGFVCTIAVESVDQVAAAVEPSGGTIALPKMAVPGIGWLFYAKDTEGNIFGCLQPDASAK
jgi:uncharacterized protein